MTTRQRPALRPGALALQLALGLAGVSGAHAQNAFELGTVTVVGAPVDGAPASETAMDQQAMARDGRDTVGAAVALLPGVALSRNSRNEETVYVRGFDPRQVPVFVDGVPLYVPYDGYVDYGRFTTFDLAEIRVAKAGASLLYGPNTLGGVINLVTRKPTRAFEGDARLGFASGGERKAAVNLGTHQGRWYAQLGLSYLDADRFPLPRGFVDHKAQPTDTGSRRENADRTDRRLSFKLGLAPNATDEYAIGYVRQDGAKGNPVYTGQSRSGIRYWRWPYWDKDSLYLVGNTRLGQHNVLKARLFHDRYANGIDAYADATYGKELVNSNFPSAYRDRSVGGSLELAHYAIARHELRVALHVKEDRHSDRNPADPRAPAKDYRDVTASLALEDTIALADAWRLRLGLSRDRREAREVYQWPTGSTSATNGVAELVHTLAGDGNEAYAIASRKTRFPTIKDRYSARMGSALPNPDLRPEVATHLELGLRGRPWNGAQGQAALFHSRITDLVQNAYVPAPTGTCGTGSDTCAQAQNIGRARHVGLELSLQQELARGLSLTGAYTYLARRNLSDPSVQLTDTPRHRLFAALSWLPSDAWELRGTLEAETGRKAAFAGSGRTAYRELAGFGVAGVKAIWKPRPDMALDFGVNNLTDKWYELSDGFPLPGRTWFVHGSYRF